MIFDAQVSDITGAERNTKAGNKNLYFPFWLFNSISPVKLL